MPELPEIETIKRGLEDKIIGKRISEIERLDVSPSKKPDGQFFVDGTDVGEDLLGQKIEGLERKGKGLIIHLGNDCSLLIHLKMTGQIILTEPDGERFGGGHPTESVRRELPDNTTRSILFFEDGTTLYFNDQRKFGYIKLKKTAQLPNEPFVSRLGPDALSNEFTPEYLYRQLQRRRTSVKAVLLDQKTVAGIGNIYADEALHLAKIHPERMAEKLSKEESKHLQGAIQDVLEESLRRGGTSFTNFVNHLGVKGDYLQNARVFRREGKNCLECGNEIIKKRVAGRGTHICENCQK